MIPIELNGKLFKYDMEPVWLNEPFAISLYPARIVAFQVNIYAGTDVLTRQKKFIWFGPIVHKYKPYKIHTFISTFDLAMHPDIFKKINSDITDEVKRNEPKFA